jgi:hypothetical protein
MTDVAVHGCADEVLAFVFATSRELSPEVRTAYGRVSRLAKVEALSVLDRERVGLTTREQALYGE